MDRTRSLYAAPQVRSVAVACCSIHARIPQVWIRPPLSLHEAALGAAVRVFAAVATEGFLLRIHLRSRRQRAWVHVRTAGVRTLPICMCVWMCMCVSTCV